MEQYQRRQRRVGERKIDPVTQHEQQRKQMKKKCEPQRPAGLFHASDVCVTDPSGGGESEVKKIYCPIVVTTLLVASNSTLCCPVPWRSGVGFGRESPARGSVWLKPRGCAHLSRRLL